MKSLAWVVFSILLAGVAQVPTVQAQAELVGCVSQIPNGGLELVAESSGTSYVLDGDLSILVRKIDHLVRVRGQEKSSGVPNNAQPTFVVQQVEEIANTCTSPLPATTPVTVVGKAGEGQVAIPITTSASAGQTTPGFQTEGVMDQEAPSSGRVRAPSARTQESPYAPSNTAQAAQTSAAANTFAEAATRSEIEPGNTLGGESYAASSGTQNAAAARSVVVQLRGDGSQQFSPATVTVKVGTTVKWTNASTRTHDISANPGKQLSTTTLPAGAKPFDSGFLRPGASFTYSFKVPGVYRYVCSVGCVGNASGEVVVQR